jgi:hypothetical protein
VQLSLKPPELTVSQWVVGSIFILFIGMSLGELASAAPTSGGVSITCMDASLLSNLRVVALLLDPLTVLDRRL